MAHSPHESARPYHEVLGVPPGASRSEIRAAFRRLAFACHPDRNPEGAAEAHQRFLELSEAFSALMDGAAELPVPAEPCSKSQPPPEPEPATSPGARASELDLDGLKFADDEEEDEELGDLRQGPAPAPPSVWTLRQHRSRVRGLARQMALVDRRGRIIDAVMRAVTLLLAVTGVALLAAHLLPDEPAVTLGTALLVLFGAIVAAAWLVAFRETRIDRHEPLAEEILRRRGVRIGTPAET